AARLGPQGLTRIPGTEGRRIKSLARDRQGTLWLVSTMGPTLWMREGALRAEPAPLGALGSDANSVFEDSRGTVWLGHAQHGLLRWDPQTGALVQEVPPSFAGRRSLGAYLIREDATGRLWVGTQAGLLVRGSDGAWRLFGPRDGLHPTTVRGLTHLPDGT